MATRSTKDAIHAAIVRGDDIVQHLDDAIKNPHHEYYRKKGGLYDTKVDPDGRLAYISEYAALEARCTQDAKETRRSLRPKPLAAISFTRCSAI